MTEISIKIFFFSCFCMYSAISFSQTRSDLYLFTLEKRYNGEYVVHSPKFLSGFNKGGYTNQPSFTPSGEILVSVRKKGDTQNDIWQLNLNTRKYRRLTQTSAIEYSPRIHPDEEQLTVLRKIEGEPVDQQVCNIHLRSGAVECVTGKMRDVGYYSWLSPVELGLFRIEEGANQLIYFNVYENKSRRITTAIGRTLVGDKAGWLIYVHKFTAEYWYIKKYNPATSRIEIIIQTIGKNEDFAIAPDGTYFMGNDHLLFAVNPQNEKAWKQIADLSVYGIRYITRIAISPDGKKLVLVAVTEKS